MSLQQLEQRIHKSVLKHTNHPISYSQKQFEFKETCYAIKEIIHSKLYRFTHPNLEQYFLKTFGTSRAQVYRLLDAYHVLYELRDFKRIPHRYRVCKELKSHCATTEELRRSWNAIVNACSSEWEVDTVQVGTLDTTLEVDACNLSGGDCFLDMQKPVEPLLDSSLQDTVQSEFLKCQDAMTSLAELGYQLIPFVGGEWKRGQITEWRIVPSHALWEEYKQHERRRRSKSLEHLLLAASTVQ
jgi:hypothetical protein